MAVMGCVPCVRAAAVHCACPEASVTEVQRGVAPSSNVTLPVMVPAPGAVTLTVAVKTTACPTTEGFTDDITAAEVLALFTCCASGVDVLLPAKFVSPL